MQEATKARIGYYGRYAVCRNVKLEDAYNRIKNGEKYIIRLKSPGDFEKKVVDYMIINSQNIKKLLESTSIN